ncbi:MAG: hypothetical protein NTU73_07150, partial [Ignavibacteriae bacterium]|nr:hypothetical protein [Ignavibacteriota bacterium]
MFGKKIFIASLFLVLSVFIGYSMYAQNDDDPNLDQLPKSMRNLPPAQYKPMLPPVTTSDGYDNFYLGIDFAEPHISTHPSNPSKIFTAFNTNATHYTLNGNDWYINNPAFPSPAGDPVTAYDSLGNLFYENMYSPSTSITGCYVVVSSNNGVSWSAPVWGINGNDKNWIAADQTGGPFANYVYSVMTPGSFSRSTDHGLSFA